MPWQRYLLNNWFPTRRFIRQRSSGGAAAFKVHCVQCHGSGATGSKGYPNLNDDDWLWGGDINAIHYTLTHGIRNPEHAETRQSAMPQFGCYVQTG
jgi:cytochrome c oxidase cbb3-type subunit 3